MLRLSGLLEAAVLKGDCSKRPLRGCQISQQTIQIHILELCCQDSPGICPRDLKMAQEIARRGHTAWYAEIFLPAGSCSSEERMPQKTVGKPPKSQHTMQLRVLDLCCQDSPKMSFRRHHMAQDVDPRIQSKWYAGIFYLPGSLLQCRANAPKDRRDAKKS